MLKHFSLPLLASVLIIISTFFISFRRNLQTTTTNLQPGCYYQQVQCIRAPCNPILVCPTINPTIYVPPAPPLETLQTKELSNGDIKITNPTYGFEIVVPVTYVLSGNPQSFSVGFNGPDSGTPPPHDLSGISFRINDLTESTLESQAQKENPNEPHTFYPAVINSFSGIKFACSFLVSGKCYYFNFGTGKFLFVSTRVSDDNNRGYQNEIDKILSSLKKVSPAPTCIPRPKCLDQNPRCLMPETPDMCSALPKPTAKEGQPTTYSCPPGGWVNCMPILTPDTARQCSPEGIAWIKTNCPDFQGVAY